MFHQRKAQKGRRRGLKSIGAAILSAFTLGATFLATGPASASGPRALHASAEPWAKAKTVGFIMVGEESDEGYNQAVYEASLKVKKALGVKTLLAANVPETQQVTTVMQQMVNEGAKIIFATSYGYQSYAYAFAKSHPKVLVLHQGGTYAGKKFPANLGTYFGEAYDPVSLGGMAAGAVTKTNKLGFVYAFPIPRRSTMSTHSN